MAKAKKAPSQGLDPKVLYGILLLVALGGGGWIAYSVATGGGATATEPIELTGIENATQLLEQAKGVAAGPESGAQVMVFSDFTCPACQGFATFIEPMLRAEYIETDKVRFVYYDFPLGGVGHEHGFLAARAARCAGEQNKFWEYHDVLFARQSEWSRSRTSPIGALVGYGELIGLDQNAFEQCVESDRFADVVTANRLLGERLGVNQTPTVFIGSRSVVDWRNWDDVKAMIEQELGATSQGSL